MKLKIHVLAFIIGFVFAGKEVGAARGSRRRPTTCPTSCLEGDSLVCGSDGNIYTSECELRMKNCGKPVTPVPKDQCLAGRQVVCEQQCPDEQVEDPVCGTDSNTYPSPCHLGVETCRQGVKLAHYGACNDLTQEEVCPSTCPEPTPDQLICASNGNVYKSYCEMRMFTCGERVVNTTHEHCKLTSGCSPNCQPTADGPVCASDGKIYVDDCQMKQKNCGKHIYEIPMAYCLVAEPEYSGCPRDCQGVNQTKVCGSDGNIYSSECELKLLTCGNKKPVSALPLSDCSARLEHCNRNMCSAAYEPVCGADGVTYSNMCRLNMAKCLRGARVAHPGVCHDHFMQEVCPDSCPPSSVGDFDGPVCGSDGNVYPNACEMKRVTCGHKVVPLSLKHCPITAHCDLNCPNLSRPICGSDGNLYKSKCHMLTKNCGKHIFMVPLHHCLKRVFKGCFEICPMTFDPTCGTDTKTYSNSCFLQIETCRSKGKVRLAYRGRCGSASPEADINELTKLQLLPLVEQSRTIKSP